MKIGLTPQRWHFDFVSRGRFSPSGSSRVKLLGEVLRITVQGAVYWPLCRCHEVHGGEFVAEVTGLALETTQHSGICALLKAICRIDNDFADAVHCVLHCLLAVSVYEI